MSTDPNPPQPAEDPDAPIDPMEALAQRYLDGTLDPAAEAEAERLLEEDPAFADLVGGYASFFSALDRHAYEAPPDLATSAVANWSAALPQPQAGWLQIFGGLKRGVGVFLVLDGVLAALLVGLLLARGPLALLKSWVLGIKDLVVLAAHLVPSAEVAAVLVPTLMLLCAAALGGVTYGLRTALARAEAA